MEPPLPTKASASAVLPPLPSSSSSSYKHNKTKYTKAVPSSASKTSTPGRSNSAEKKGDGSSRSSDDDDDDDGVVIFSKEHTKRPGEQRAPTQGDTSSSPVLGGVVPSTMGGIHQQGNKLQQVVQPGIVQEQPPVHHHPAGEITVSGVYSTSGEHKAKDEQKKSSKKRDRKSKSTKRSSKKTRRHPTPRPSSANLLLEPNPDIPLDRQCRWATLLGSRPDMVDSDRMSSWLLEVMAISDPQHPLRQQAGTSSLTYSSGELSSSTTDDEEEQQDKTNNKKNHTKKNTKNRHHHGLHHRTTTPPCPIHPDAVDRAQTNECSQHHQRMAEDDKEDSGLGSTSSLTSSPLADINDLMAVDVDDHDRVVQQQPEQLSKDSQKKRNKRRNNKKMTKEQQVSSGSSRKRKESSNTSSRPAEEEEQQEDLSATFAEWKERKRRKSEAAARHHHQESGGDSGDSSNSGGGPRDGGPRREPQAYC